MAKQSIYYLRHVPLNFLSLHNMMKVDLNPRLRYGSTLKKTFGDFFICPHTALNYRFGRFVSDLFSPVPGLLDPPSSHLSLPNLKNLLQPSQKPKVNSPKPKNIDFNRFNSNFLFCSPCLRLPASPVSRGSANFAAAETSPR